MPIARRLSISRLWLKAIGLVCFLVALCSLAIALTVIPLSRQTAYQLAENYAISVLNQVHDLVDAKHQELESFRQYALAARKRELINITAIVGRYLDSSLEESRRAALLYREPLHLFQSQVLEFIRSFRYARDDYVWVANYDSVLISHPDPNLHNRDFSNVKDVYGNYIVPPMVEKALQEGAGFTSYWWNRLGEPEPVEKLTYSRHFEPWQWVYGTGVYVDDIEEEVHHRFTELITILRDKLRRITIARTGYMYIFDENFNMIVHPTAWLEGTNFKDSPNPMTGQPIGQELVEAEAANQYHLYLWDRPEEPANFVYEKISWVRFQAGFKWYIASSIYTEDLYAEAELLARRILYISITVFLVALLLGSLFMRRIIRPIQQLSEVALAVRRGNLNRRSRIQRRDEIGILSREFDAMVDTLEDHLATLDSRVREKTAALNRQMAIMETTHRQMADSIQYARTIQSAILPGPETTPPWVRDRLVIWKPKDVIGGDIFWLHTEREGFWLAVVDCTGHGVPGAVMTMVASMALDRSIKHAGLSDPAEVLTHIDRTVRRTLNQHHPGGKTDDGLDIALCYVDLARRQLRFAGAHLGLLIATAGMVRELRGERHSIGYRTTSNQTDTQVVFQTYTIALETGQIFYMATDGYASQVGGARHLPFGKRRFKQLLAEIYPLKLKDQKARLQEAMRRYQGNEEQRDDITILAFALHPFEDL